MVVLLHGAAGGWDEVAIAVAAFAVLWVAIKLAGRKPANDEDDPEADAASDADHPSTPDSANTEPSAGASVEEPTNPARRSSKPA